MCAWRNAHGCGVSPSWSHISLGSGRSYHSRVFRPLSYRAEGEEGGLAGSPSWHFLRGSGKEALPAQQGPDLLSLVVWLTGPHPCCPLSLLEAGWEGPLSWEEESVSGPVLLQPLSPGAAGTEEGEYHQLSPLTQFAFTCSENICKSFPVCESYVFC